MSDDKTRREFLKDAISGGTTVALASGPLAWLGSTLVPSAANAQVTGGQRINTGNAFVWGANAQGQQGRNDLTGRSSPVVIPGDWIYVNASAQDATSYTLSWGNIAGIRRNNTLLTAGLNNFGQLGTGNTTTASSLQQVSGSWSKVAGGNQFMCGIATNGRLYSWGNGAKGNLGTSSVANVSNPVQVAGSWTQVACGTGTVGAIKTNGELWMWGSAANGALANNSTTSQSSPIQVTGSWTQISVGDSHAAAIRSDGTMWTWGLNTYGQLGDGSTASRSSPVQVAGSWSQVSCGLNTTLGIQTSGSLWGWGSGFAGVLAVASTQTSSPVQLFAGTQWSSISCGTLNQAYGANKDYAYALGIKTTGTLWSWGYNASGQLGQNDLTTRSSPAQIPGSWTQASAGGSWAIGLRK